MRPAVQTELPGKADDRVLGGMVGVTDATGTDRRRSATDAHHRREVDDGAALALLDHLRQAVQAAVVDAVLVDRDHLLPRVLRPADARVVDDDVELAPGVDDGLDRAFYVFLARRVGAQGTGLAAGVFDLGGDGRGRLLVDVGRHHPRAFVPEDGGDRLADA